MALQEASSVGRPSAGAVSAPVCPGTPGQGDIRVDPVISERWLQKCGQTLLAFGLDEFRGPGRVPLGTSLLLDFPFANRAGVTSAAWDISPSQSSGWDMVEALLLTSCVVGGANGD